MSRIMPNDPLVKTVIFSREEVDRLQYGLPFSMHGGPGTGIVRVSSVEHRQPVSTFSLFFSSRLFSDPKGHTRLTSMLLGGPKVC